ncbi:MAG: double-strand break repair protein AddB [Alphaproteobacteria bacterium]|nr:double-strand break repair protein AddB [Alphaproteobacteria bacterium]
MENPHGVYTIPSGQNFLKKLARGLLEVSSQSDDPVNALIHMRVLLPTRRAARGLRDAFLDLKKGQTVLLPRLQPLGDVDADELDLTLSGLGLDITDIPPAIKSLERQFLLAKYIRAKDKNLPHDQSLTLAKNLATLLDQVHTEGLDFSRLSDLVPYAEFSAHWQETLTFLEIITTTWPKILEERGQIDPAERRALLMNALTDLWTKHPPDTPIIAAGSTGSIPTTAKLLQTIAQLPKGSVILPGLDLGLDEESWNVIDDTHPQRTMKNLLTRMDLKRDQIKLWPSCEKDDPPRRRLIRAMMHPAQTFGSSLLEEDSIQDFKDNVTICETANAREQAAVIATSLRMILEEHGKTACFVTPDRSLARRVTTALKRWGIDADDSAGQSLITTTSGIFITTFLSVLEKEFAPIPLLEFLKSPLFIKHDLPLAEFERLVLRGPRPAAGLEGLARRIKTLKDQEQELLEPVMNVLRSMSLPLEVYLSGLHAPKEMLLKIISCIEDISGGAESLWSHPESDALSNFMSQLLNEAEQLPEMDFAEWASVLRALLLQETFREIQPKHPRIIILGQLESRLIQHDLMILAGLNEGMWPSEPAHDPWMSRPMRNKFGLPPAARSIGLSAHDFTEGLSAPRVIITRSIKQDGAETVPSRWLQRLSTLLTASGVSPDWTQNNLIAWTRLLDFPTSRYARPEPPQPCPPRDKRPQKLSATRIEKWMKNPYHIYVEKILGLKRLDPLEDDAIFSDRGNFLHDVLEEFVKCTEYELPDNAKDIFMEISQQKLAELESLSPHWHYWWPRMEKIADWVIKTESDWRTTATPWRQEVEGLYKIYESQDGTRSFTVTAKADRIDRMKAGGAAIIDYKTGSTPLNKDILSGHAPQLPIEALILQKGGFANTPMGTAEMAYWKVAHNGKVDKLTSKKTIIFEELIPAAEKGLLSLILQFEDQSTPYTPFPPLGTRIYDDERAIAHLARVAEWSAIGGEGEDNESDDGEAA